MRWCDLPFFFLDEVFFILSACRRSMYPSNKKKKIKIRTMRWIMNPFLKVSPSIATGHTWRSPPSPLLLYFKTQSAILEALINQTLHACLGTIYVSPAGMTTQKKKKIFLVKSRKGKAQDNCWKGCPEIIIEE